MTFNDVHGRRHENRDSGLAVERNAIGMGLGLRRRRYDILAVGSRCTAKKTVIDPLPIERAGSGRHHQSAGRDGAQAHCRSGSSRE